MSKFHISFDTILSLIKNGQIHIEDFHDFINKSMLKEELDNYKGNLNKQITHYEEHITNQNKIIDNLSTTREDMEAYVDLESIFNSVNNKKRKEVQRNMQNISDKTRSFKNDYEQYKKLQEKKNELYESTNELNYYETYVETGVQNILSLLIEKQFITNEGEDYIMTQRGQEASCLAEINGLVFVEFLEYCNISEKDLISIIDSWRSDHIWDKHSDGKWFLRNPIWEE